MLLLLINLPIICAINQLIIGSIDNDKNVEKPRSQHVGEQGVIELIFILEAGTETNNYFYY